MGHSEFLKNKDTTPTDCRVTKLPVNIGDSGRRMKQRNLDIKDEDSQQKWDVIGALYSIRPPCGEGQLERQ